jgi:hypothetical protein
MPAPVKLRDFNPATDGTFAAVISLFEDPAFRKVLVTTDDGTCQGYERIADGRLWPGPLVTPTPAKLAADAAAAAALADEATKMQAATLTIAANVLRVKNNGAGSGTDANRDNWLMALTYLASRQG